MKYYTEKIAANPKWSFAGIFADPRQAGNQHQREGDNFNDMIVDC